MKFSSLIAAGFTAALLAIGPVNAQPTKPDPLGDFFKGKQIRFVLGAAAGQDYDLWARLIGRYLTLHIPGHPNVVIENMPGAGHLIATNWLYNVAPHDGTVWGMVSRNIPSQALLKLPGAKFDPLKFNWIGSPELTNRGCFSMDSSGIKKAEDLFEHQLVVGGTGAGSSVSQTPILLHNLLGMKIKLVEGYTKPQDVALAMDRGEVGGLCQTVQSFAHDHADWFKSGKAHVLFTLERDPVPGYNAPTIYQFTKTDEQRKIIDFYSSSIELGRPIMLPPGVPKDRVAALRHVFDDVMKDPQFVADAQKMGFEVTARSGEQLEKLITVTMQTSPDIIKKTADLTQNEGATNKGAKR